MYKSESITNNLLKEVDLLSCRLTNIQQAYCNTSHLVLRERLSHENRNIYQRIREIFIIAKKLKKRNKEIISFSSLLLEKCERAIYQNRVGENLFFL